MDTSVDVVTASSGRGFKIAPVLNHCRSSPEPTGTPTVMPLIPGTTHGLFGAETFRSPSPVDHAAPETYQDQHKYLIGCHGLCIAFPWRRCAQARRPLSSVLPLPALVRDAEDQVVRLRLTHRCCLRAAPQAAYACTSSGLSRWLASVYPSMYTTSEVHHIRGRVVVEPEHDEADQAAPKVPALRGRHTVRRRLLPSPRRARGTGHAPTSRSDPRTWALSASLPGRSVRWMRPSHGRLPPTGRAGTRLHLVHGSQVPRTDVTATAVTVLNEAILGKVCAPTV